MSDDRLIIHQLRAGRDFAKSDPVAAQMANFVYLIADREAGECVIVDPAWDVDGIVTFAGERDLEVTGALVTHHHPDHVGGPLFGHDVTGLARLLELVSCPIHVNKVEAPWVQAVTGIEPGNMVLHDHGDRISVGAVEVECLHTPGHTPGSQCFRCGTALVTGDTVFLQGCGRTDFPGGDPEEMWRTLTQRLKSLPGDLMMYPGHDYGQVPHATLEKVRATNPVLADQPLSAFLRHFG